MLLTVVRFKVASEISDARCVDTSDDIYPKSRYISDDDSV